MLRARSVMIRRYMVAVSLVFLLIGTGCDDCAGDGDEAPDTGTAEEARHGLTAEQASQVLVKIGERTITVGEFADRLAEQSPYLRARYNSPERRREYLDNLVRFELMAIEAERRNLDEIPEVDRTRKQVMIQQMMKELFEDQIQLSDITDEEIRAYYEAHADEFHKPEQVRASHILVKNRAAAQRLLGQIRQNESDVNFFREAAEEHNEDPATRDRFGDLRFFSRPGEEAPADEPEGEEGEGQDGQEGEEGVTVPDAVAEAAFSIEQIGGVHPRLVETDAGFHIVKLTGRRAALHRSLEDARRPIQNRLFRERREQRINEFLEGLRREANVEENFDLLDQVQIDIPAGDVPEVPDPPAPTKAP